MGSKVAQSSARQLTPWVPLSSEERGKSLPTLCIQFPLSLRKRKGTGDGVVLPNEPLLCPRSLL